MVASPVPSPLSTWTLKKKPCLPPGLLSFLQAVRHTLVTLRNCLLVMLVAPLLLSPQLFSGVEPTAERDIVQSANIILVVKRDAAEASDPAFGVRVKVGQGRFPALRPQCSSVLAFP